MGAAAVKMLTDKSLHQKMAKAARHRAEDFEQEKVIAQYEAYYLKVMKGM
jgi:glycosyltransferase involved in cell wall biosynthesis